jgi:adenosylmethionine-8-amino-7-oxononanoate aminotransferase
MSTQPLSGSELEDIKLMAQKHFWPHAKPAGDISEETGLKTITKGEGVWLYDENDQPWYDTTSCLWLVNLGHGRTDIADAAYTQMKEVSFTPMGSFSPPAAKLSAKIASYSPDKDSRVFFVSGGAEANETAIKMARKYHINNGESSRYKVISRRNSYHGATYATMSMGGGTRPPYEFEPLMPGSVKIANYDSYRYGFSTKSEEQASEEYANDLERAILGHNPSTVSAFIAEPISTATGIHVPNKAYFQMIREICDKYGVLMISDEVITGFGRTGSWFAIEQWDVTPDIITFAKACTSGYLPIGGTIATKKISDAFIGDESKTFTHLMTFGGNPASTAAGVKTLEIMEDEHVVENSKQMGDYLMSKLEELYKYDIVGHVRGGKGLLNAVEIVKNKDSKEPYPNLAKKLGPLYNKYKMIGLPSPVAIQLAPPITVNKNEIDDLVERTENVIKDLEADN